MFRSAAVFFFLAIEFGERSRLLEMGVFFARVREGGNPLLEMGGFLCW